MTDCYHCGLNVPANSGFELLIDECTQHFCCPGCQAVAESIVAGGLEGFYRFRAQNSLRPDVNPASVASRQRFEAFDLEDVQAEFVQSKEGGQRSAQLLIEGISCAACVWLIEHHLQSIDGVSEVRVNASTHRCWVQWQSGICRLSELMAAIGDIGYQPMPATEDRQQALREKENRQALMRLAIAGFGMMQVGMVAVALYTGADASWQSFLRWLSWLIATPVVFYSAAPFFANAKRALLSRSLTMDVPVALAIGGAYGASSWATVFGGGEVYFDSVSMFTFFLLWGRYLEMRARHRNGIESGRMAQLLPVTAEKRGARQADSEGSASADMMSGYEWGGVPVKALLCGDVIRVAAGSTLPGDGLVLSGCSGVVETLMTGEPDAVLKKTGDTVIAGSTNTDSVLVVELTAVGAATRLSAVEQLVDQAQQHKPALVAMADRLSVYFVAAVLLVSALVFSVWWQLEPSEAVWITLSVLVVTCPCALSLASPAALTAAASWLRGQGLLVTRGHVLEGLDKIDRVVFDKTGTLTLGAPQVVGVFGLDGQPLSTRERAECLARAAALEVGSSHPVGKAFDAYIGQLSAESIAQTVGAGVAGIIDDEHWQLGKPTFVSAGLTALEPPFSGQWLLLAQTGQPRAWIQLRDELRDTAKPLLAALAQRGLKVELLSGDAEPAVARVASELGLQHWRSDVGPDEKLAHLQQLQAQGERVLMVGDGINDVPVLSGAFVSVAMGGATDLAQTCADSVLLGNDLYALEKALRCAHMTRRVIRQNFTWALAYNLIALPLAALGWVPPWAAAIGMSSSSLIVVGNALRINRLKG